MSYFSMFVYVIFILFLAQCGAGTYNAIDGHAECIPCPKNFYQDQVGQKTCKACSTNEVTAGPGSTAQSNCTSGGRYL